MASKIKVDELETVDGTGTIALQNQLSGMTVASMPTGSVLQVVVGNDTTETTISTTTFTDVGLSATITPSAGSKILVQWTSQGSMTQNCGFGVRLVRDSTTVYTTGSNTKDIYNALSAGNDIRTRGVYYKLDTHGADGSTSVTYKIQIAVDSSNAVTLNKDNTNTEIVLTEIAG
jgi:hypothetical protein